MTLELSRDAFAGALRAVVDVVEARTTIPILANVLLQTSGGELTITGTDLDRHASMSIPAAGEIDITIDARKLLVAVTSLKGEHVTIAPADGRTGVTLKSGRGVRTLATLSSKDFPQRSTLEGATRYTLPAASFARLLSACSVAICTDDTRYYLCGVYLHRVGEQLIAAATDGHRLVTAAMDAPDASEGVPQVIIPTKTVGLLRKLLVKGAEVSIAATENALDIRCGSFRLVSKTVDGSFPDYKRVIPADGSAKTTVTVARDAIVDAVGGVAAVVEAQGEQKTRTVRLDFVAEAGLHSVSASDVVGTSAHDEFEGALTGLPAVVGMNSKYFTATIGILSEGATLTVACTDATSPVRFSSDKDPDLTVVIMPMRI